MKPYKNRDRQLPILTSPLVLRLAYVLHDKVIVTVVDTALKFKSSRLFFLKPYSHNSGFYTAGVNLDFVFGFPCVLSAMIYCRSSSAKTIVTGSSSAIEN